MGARAKARRAADAAQKKYYEALSSVEAAPEFKRIGDKNARVIDDALGGNVSYSTKRLAMQADKVGRSINNDESYKKSIGSYNQRYAQLKDQLAGKSSQRFYVDNPTPQGNVSSNAALNSATGGSPNGAFGFNGEPQSAISTANLNNASISRPEADPNTMTWKGMDQAGLDKLSAKNADRTFYNTREEALAEATKFMDERNAKQSAKKSGLLGAALQQTDPNKFIQSQTLSPIANGWRGSMGEAAGAYSDMSALSNKISGSGVNQYAEQYAALSDKLKLKLRREDTGPLKEGGLLASELAGSNLDLGVIKT